MRRKLVMLWLASCLAQAPLALASAASPPPAPLPAPAILPLYTALQQRLADPAGMSAESRQGLHLMQAQLESELGLLGLAEQHLEPIDGGPTIRQLRQMSWLLLARARLERRQNTEAAALLGRIDIALPPPLEAERLQLQALLAQQRGAPVEAMRHYQRLQQAEGGPLLARLNYATLLLQSDRAEHGVDLLLSVAAAESEGEAVAALRDRAALLLGYHSLQQQRYEEAAKWLQQVRLEGPYSDSALLALGWVELERHGPEQAMVPWLELLARPQGPAAEEALLAIPLALQRKGPSERVIAHFRSLIEELEARRGRYREQLARLEADGEESPLGATAPLPGPDDLAAARALQGLLALQQTWGGSAPAEAAGGDASGAIWALLERGYPAAEEGSGTGVAGALIRRTAEFVRLEQEGARGRHTPGEAADVMRQQAREALGAELAECRAWYRTERSAALQRRLQRLDGYLQQARLAIARTHEQALLRQEQGR